MSTLTNLIVLVIGNGGREHALVWLAGRSPIVEKVFGWGPNAGILIEPKYQSLGDKMPDFAGIIEAAKKHGVDLALIGPEAPLVEGLSDALREAGIPVFGPSADAARLEGSKLFAKQAMDDARVPTAPAVSFMDHPNDPCLEPLLDHVLATGKNWPIVVKADGLCAGKGAMVCHDLYGAVDAIHRCLIAKEFSKAGQTLLIEQYLHGHPGLPRAEFSVLALVDIHGNFIMMPAAQDHKPVNDGDDGLNTGGMGAYAPIPWMTSDMMAQVGQTIFKPILAEMKKRDTPFSGVLYAGLIWTAQGPKVVEFNVRFGDPELQPLVMLLETDLILVLKAIADGESIAGLELNWKPGAAVCLVLASKGYPGSYEKGLDIYGLDQMPKDDPTFKAFHAGTRLRHTGQFLQTAGGRVLGLTQYWPQGLEGAAVRVRYLAALFSFGQYGQPGAGLHYRKDIGFGVSTSFSQNV